MPYSAVAALMILTTVLLSACAQQKMAVLEDKSAQYFGRNTAPAGGTYFSNSTNAAAAVDSISTQDLGPQASVAPAFATPFRPAAAEPAPVVQHYSWQWPVEGRVSAGFGKQREGIANEGITIAAADGAPIRAAAAGEVAYVGINVRDYGNMVILRHGHGDMSSYAHAQRIVVAKGSHVNQGDVIGYVGKTGRAKSPQLHFAVRSGDRAVDPLGKLPHNLAAL